MVELMMLLVIASLIVAASVPIVTKKHLHLPSAANHGTYMCYYYQGHLYEARKSGRINQKMLAGYPRQTTNCVFDPPAKASIFQITAIGGGGGGGDAGYDGSLPRTVTNPPSTMSPNNITTALLESKGFKVSAAALTELRLYMGEIWAFAQGLNSGKQGTLYAAGINENCIINSCPSEQEKWEWVTSYTSGEKVLCAGYDNQTSVTPKSVYTCYDDEGKVTRQAVNYEYKSMTCSKYHPAKDKYDCKYPNPKTYDCSYDDCKPKYKEIDAMCPGGTETVCKEVPNPSGFLTDGSSTQTVCETRNKPDVPCKKTVPDGHDCTHINKTCTYPCTNVKIGTDPAYYETHTETVGSTSETVLTAKEGETCSSGGSIPSSTYQVTGCNLSESARRSCSPTISGPYATTTYSQGISPFCTSSPVNGDLNLAYTSNIYTAAVPADGPNLNTGSPGTKFSFCVGGGCGPTFGTADNGGYSEASFGGNSTKSFSATAAPQSNTLSYTSVDLPILDATTSTAVVTHNEKFYSDTQPTLGHNGTNGSCTPSSSGLPDCRNGGSDRTGYCLRHHYQTRPQAEKNGSYEYYDTYDVHNLKKGMFGKPGEFKTIVVRSLNGVDRTINIGRGGSGATINLGKKGANGSDTTFGSIVKAKGGEGGEGNISLPEERMPTYETTMNYTALKACFTGTSNPAGCAAWKANPAAISWYRNSSGEKGQVPLKKSVGGMFSFVLSAFDSTNDATVEDIVTYSGKGGNGGGVEHFCWAGQDIINFEKKELIKSSTYHQGYAPAGAVNIVPAACRQAFRNIPATPGYDGALIITW